MIKEKPKIKKSTRNLSILLLVVVLFAMLFMVFEEQINRQFSFFMKNYKCDFKNVDLSGLTIKEPDDNAWHNNHHIIAHAMGGIDGIAYTNSEDAFFHNYEKGYRLFEADIIFTADGMPMLFHDRYERSIVSEIDKGGVHSDWFMNNKDPFGYIDLTLDDFLEYMVEHSDIYLITDVKDYFLDKSLSIQEYKGEHADYNQRVAQYIYDWATEHNREDILERVIIQLYSEDCYEKTHLISPSLNYIYTLYLFNSEDTVDHLAIAEFCANNGISAVVMPYQWTTASIIDIYTSAGLPVYVHAVNDMPLLKNQYRIGVSGVFSSFISPEDNLEYFNKYRNRGFIYRL